MTTTPEQLHKMLTYCIDFTRTMLEKAGDFYPFGCTLDKDGVQTAVGVDDGNRKSDQREIYKRIEHSFAECVSSENVAAIAIAANTDIPAQYSPDFHDGLRVHLEADGFSRYIYVPYKVEKVGVFKRSRSVTFAEPFSVEIPRKFFNVSA